MTSLSKFTRALFAVAALAGTGALAQAPANDTCAGAQSLTVGTGRVSSPAAANLQNAAAALESPMTCSSTSKNSTWYTFIAPADGLYRIDTCTGTNTDTTMVLYTGTCGGTLTAVTSSCVTTGSCGTFGAAGTTLTLTAGTTYWVQVAAASTVTLTATSTWTLSIEPVPTAAPANDACTGALTLTPSTTPDVTVTSPLAFPFTAAQTSDAVMPCGASRNDTWYAFTPTVSGYYRLDTCNWTNYDSVISLWSGSCGALQPVSGACNDDSCSTASSVSTYLAAGNTYYLQVARFGTTAPVNTSFHAVNLTFLPPSPSNEYCSASSPLIPLATTVDVSTLSPDAGAGFLAAQDDLRLDGGYIGLGHTTSQGAGRDVAYQFRATDEGRYSFRLSAPITGSTATILALTDSCVPQSSGTVTYSPPQLLFSSNRTTAAEEITCAPLTANQTVFVWVDESSLSTSGGAYTLEVNRCVMEVEPNDTPATATALSCATTGGITDAGEADFFVVGAFAASDAGIVPRLFAMAEAYAAGSTNIDMRVTTETNTLEYDNDNLHTDFGSLAPAVAGVPLPPVPTYLRINHNSSTTLAEPYVVYSAVQTGAPTPESEPNDIIDAGNRSATNYFVGSIGDAGDSDFFTFSANAGEVIFAALDPVPERTDAGPTGFNFNMLLIAPDGGTVVSALDTSTTVTYTPTGGNLSATTPVYPSEALTWRARTSGDYAIRVYKTSGAFVNPYLLSVTVGCSDLAPTLDATLVPAEGSPSGNELVTLTGTNFSNRSVVRFGTGIASIVSVTPTTIVVRTPPSANSGLVSVSVTNGVGLSATVPDAFSYEDPPGLPPILTSVSPTFGPIAGGTAVTLNGSVFRRDAGVFFDVGGVVTPATSVTFNTAARLTAVAPPHDAGLASITVINFDGLSSTLAGAFQYQGAPFVAGIAPDAGLTTGGQTVTLTGSDFRPGATVRFGGNAATGVAIADGGLSLTAVTPSQTTNGPVDVTVRNTDSSTFVVPNGFLYSYPAPSLTAVTPNQGTTLGNSSITLTGTNFTSAVTVTIGGTPATNVSRTSATTITARTPAGTAGPADVVVTNVDGQVASIQNGFRYYAPPQLTAIEPANGPVQGGTLVTLRGANFLPGAIVRIGGVPAFAVTVIDANTATAVTNANVAGPADVTLINSDLEAQQVTLARAFTFDPAPTVTEVSPVSGTIAGGTVVTVRGTGFLSGAQVLFGSTPASNVTFTSATEFRATSPARPVGVVSITVRNPDGQLSELPRAYRFVAPPMLTAISPATGDAAGGTVVTLTGSGFTATATVTFDGTPAARVSFVSGTELEAEAPAHAPGTVDVQVDVDGAAATLAGAFTYARNAPTLSAVAPVSGPIEGGTLLTLAGTGFAQGMTVTVGGTAASDVVVVSSVLARAVAPAHAAGAVDVVVTNDDQKSATLAGAFTYVTPPTEGGGTITDGGTGAVGEDPVIPTPNPGGVSCGCSSFDPTSLSLAGLGVLMVLSRRRRRS